MKKYFLLTIFLILFSHAAFAEKISVRIEPAQIISTHHDETEIGDWIEFKAVNDVYISDKLYIKKGTPVWGFVEFFHPNGWAGDSAEIQFKTFKTTDVNREKITINYPLVISGNSLKANDIKQYISWELTSFLRGSEIYIEPDKKVFNLFIER